MQFVEAYGFIMVCFFSSFFHYFLQCCECFNYEMAVLEHRVYTTSLHTLSNRNPVHTSAAVE